ncbi:phage tail length tape measure family protein [Azospirillum sp. 11R-A]|uniref:phage tail length tape measure family protein n=1 Tax=Azospirillum sp. 11R-A TaxID=3111634 RepID=UPI003C288007
MSDMTLVLRIKADGTAEVVGAAKQVEAAVAGIGAAGAEAGRIAKAATDEAALAQAKLARLVQETATPVERLKARLAELETLAPFAGTAEQARALARATDELDRAIASHSDEVRIAAAAQERLADLVEKTRTPVDRLQATLAELERLRPFATSVEEAQALSHAITAAEAALEGHSEAARQAASAQSRLAALIDETRTPVERLQGRLAELAALRPFATTEADADALTRAITSTEAALEGQSTSARDAAAAQSRLAAIMVETATPVERLRARLDELRALRPFAQSIPEAQALARAIEATETEIAQSTDAARAAVAAQGQLAQVIARTRTEGEKLEAELLRLEALRPFARTGEEAIALERALARVRAGMAATNSGAAAMARTTGLAAHEMTNLSFQAQDFIVQVGSGQGIFRPLLQQGPQAVMAVGGLSRAMALLLTPTSLVAAGFGAVALAGATVLARASAITAEVREMDIRLRALNPNLNATGAALRTMAQGIADERGVTRQDATSAVRTIALNPRIGDAALVRSLAALAQDVQAVLGGSVEEVAAKLADAFAGGAAGVRKLDEELGFLSVEEAKNIALMGRHSDQTGALATAMEALQRRFGGATKQMRSDAAEAFHELEREWDNLIEKLGSSDLAQALMRGLGQALKGMSWWVAGMPEEIQKARDLAETSALLDRTRNELAGMVERGHGDMPPANNLRQQLQALQQRYYDLQRQNGPAGGRATAPPLTRSANDITPEISQSAANQKWLNDERQAYEDLSVAMKGTAAQRVLNRAELEANREADRRNMGDTARLGLIELRRKEALVEMTAAENDRSSAVDRATTLNTQYTQELLRFTSSSADAVEHTIRHKAAMEAQAAAASNAAVSVQAMTSQLVLSAAAQAAADGAKTVSDLQTRVEWEEKVADAARGGAAAQAEAERQAEAAAQTSALLGAAQAAEAEGAAELGQLLRELAADYETLSKRSDEARKRRQGEESLRTARAELEMAQAELGLMGRAEPYRERALRSLQIQQQAAQMAKSATTEQIAEWVRLQEQIADAQALVNFQKEVQATSKEIAGSISENLYDRLMDPSKATSMVDVFKSIFKRIALAALEANIVLPIVTQVVGAMPSLFGIQAPAGAGGVAGASQGSGGLMSNATNLFSLGRAGWQMLSGGSGLAATQAAGSFATSSLGEALGLSTSAAGVIPEAAATDMMLTSTGNAVVGAAGTIGAAMPYGVVGGVLGGLAGTAMNSKAGGALVGAAAGAGAAGIGAGIWGMSAVGGPWGIAAAAVISAVMAMLGTQKKTVGPNSSGNVTLDGSGGFRTDQALADNGADAGQMQQVTDSIAKAMNAVITGIGGKLTGGDGANTGLIQYFQKDNKWFVTPQVGDKAGQKTEFTDQSQAVQFYMRESLKGLIGNGSLTGVNDDVKTVLAKSNATTSESLTKHLQLAATFQDSVDAMNNAIGLEDTARKQGKTAAADLTIAIKDFRQTASDAGLDATKAANATRNWVDTLVSGADPKTYTVYEAQAAQYRAQWSNMGDVLQAVGYSAADAAKKMDEGLNNSLKKLAKTLNTSLDQQINSALGRDFLNQITKSLEDEQTNARDLAAVGEPITKAQTLRAAQLNSIMTQLNATQLDVITSTYGATSDIGKLAQTIKAMSADAGTTAASLASFQADVQSRLYGALGNTRGSELIALDVQQAKALADAKTAGYDTTVLQQVQAAERAAKAFQLAKADVDGAYEAQITAQQDYITTLSNGAVKIAQSARAFRSAFDSLALADTSPLSDKERLEEARRQFGTAAGTFRSQTATDDEREAAKQSLLSLGPSLIQLARSYFGPTNSTDYDWVREVFAEFGDTTAMGVDAAERQLATANKTLAEMQANRASAAAIGQMQYGELSSLNSIMNQSYLVWQSSLTALQRMAGTTSSTSPTTLVDATVEDKRRRLEAFSNADIEAAFGQFADIQAARQANPAFNLALWFQTYGLSEVLNGTRKIPGFATGTDSAPAGWAWVGENGRELIQLAGGERVYPHTESKAIAQSWATANDHLPVNATGFRPRVTTSDAGLSALAAEIRASREAARRNAREIGAAVADAADRQAAVAREEGVELRRRVDKQGADFRISLSSLQYNKKRAA